MFFFAHSVLKATMSALHHDAETCPAPSGLATTKSERRAAEDIGGLMGDKSPRNKDKNKKQGEAAKKKGKADAAAKQTPPAVFEKKK